MQIDWELSQQFVSDGQGIRAAACLPPTNKDGVDSFSIVTGNQGGGLCAFGVPSGSLHPVEYQHNHSVTALLALPQMNTYVTGCKDAQIRIFDDQTHQLVATLSGHEKPVTSLSVIAKKTTTTTTNNNTTMYYLISGSWDGTAKVWDLSRKNAMIATLPNHENSVCVVGLQNNADDHTLLIATGSAGIAQNNQISGHTTRIWTVQVRTGVVQMIHAIANDHEGPIRGIASILSSTTTTTTTNNTNMLATCSNDGTVKLRTSDTGEAISTLLFLPQQQQQHPPMLLSVTSMEEENGTILVAACAEDGHVVIWNLQQGNNNDVVDPQILLHPACVWNLQMLPNGDLATCCQDGTLRIFTRATDRMAPLAEREQYAKTVQEAHQKQTSGPSPEEVAKLPLWEHGQQHRGTSEGQVQLFNKGGIAIAAQWSMASQTWIEVGQVMGSSADGGTIDGVAYDHVFPIEVDQTGGGVAELQIGYNNGENPFVAAQRFIDAHVLPQHHLNDIANYIQQRVGKDAAPTLGGGGAATAASSVTPMATSGVPMASYQHLPTPGYKSFDLPSKTGVTTLEKMKTKISEFGKLSDSQLQQLSSLMETLAATNRYHATKVSNEQLKVISDMLETTLSPNEAFPALDLARLTIVHPDAACSNHRAYWTHVMSKALSLCEETNVASLEGPAAVAIPMLSLRLFANGFRGGPGSLDAAASHLEAILKCTNQFIASKNKNVRLSVATVLYNVSCYLHSTKQQQNRPEIAAQVVASSDSILQLHRVYETEAITRALMALGTSVLASPEAKEVAKQLHSQSRVEMAASPHGDIAKAVAKEVYNALA